MHQQPGYQDAVSVSLNGVDVSFSVEAASGSAVVYGAKEQWMVAESISINLLQVPTTLFFRAL